MKLHFMPHSLTWGNRIFIADLAIEIIRRYIIPAGHHDKFALKKIARENAYQLTLKGIIKT